MYLPPFWDFSATLPPPFQFSFLAPQEQEAQVIRDVMMGKPAEVGPLLKETMEGMAKLFEHPSLAELQPGFAGQIRKIAEIFRMMEDPELVHAFQMFMKASQGDAEGQKFMETFRQSLTPEDLEELVRLQKNVGSSPEKQVQAVIAIMQLMKKHI